MHAQSRPTLCNSTDWSLQGSSVQGILQARTLKWVASSSSPDFPKPGIEPTSLVSPALAGKFFPTEPTGKPLKKARVYFSGSFNMFTISK